MPNDNNSLKNSQETGLELMPFKMAAEEAVSRAIRVFSGNADKLNTYIRQSPEETAALGLIYETINRILQTLNSIHENAQQNENDLRRRLQTVSQQLPDLTAQIGKYQDLQNEIIDTSSAHLERDQFLQRLEADAKAFQEELQQLQRQYPENPQENSAPQKTPPKIVSRPQAPVRPQPQAASAPRNGLNAAVRKERVRINREPQESIAFRRLNLNSETTRARFRKSVQMPSLEIYNGFHEYYIYSSGKKNISLLFDPSVTDLSEYHSELQKLQKDSKDQFVSRSQIEKLDQLRRKALLHMQNFIGSASKGCRQMAQVLELDGEIFQQILKDLPEGTRLPLNSLVSQAKMKTAEAQGFNDRHREELKKAGEKENKEIASLVFANAKNRFTAARYKAWDELQRLALQADLLKTGQNTVFNRFCSYLQHTAGDSNSTFEAFDAAMEEIRKKAESYLQEVRNADHPKITETVEKQIRLAEAACRCGQQLQKEQTQLKAEMDAMQIYASREDLRKAPKPDQSMFYGEDTKKPADALIAEERGLMTWLNQLGNIPNTEVMQKFARLLTVDEILQRNDADEMNRMNSRELDRRAKAKNDSEEMKLLAACSGNLVFQGQKDIRKCYEACREFTEDLRKAALLNPEMMEEAMESMQRDSFRKYRTGNAAFDTAFRNVCSRKLDQKYQEKIAKRTKEYQLACIRSSVTDVRDMLDRYFRDIKDIPLPKASKYSAGRGARTTLAVCILLNQGYRLEEILLPKKLITEKHNALEYASRLLENTQERSEKADARDQEIYAIFTKGIEALWKFLEETEKTHDLLNPSFGHDPMAALVKCAVYVMHDDSQEIDRVYFKDELQDKTDLTEGEQLNKIEMPYMTVYGYMLEPDRDLCGKLLSRNRDSENVIMGLLLNHPAISLIADQVKETEHRFAARNEQLPVCALNPENVVKSFTDYVSAQEWMQQDPAALTGPLKELVANAQKITRLVQDILKEPKVEALLSPFLADGTLSDLFQMQNFTGGKSKNVVPLVTKVPSKEECIAFAKKMRRERYRQADQVLQNFRTQYSKKKNTYAAGYLKEGIAAMTRFRDRYAVPEIPLNDSSRPELEKIANAAVSAIYMAQCAEKGKKQSQAEDDLYEVMNTSVMQLALHTTVTENVFTFRSMESIQKLIRKAEMEAAGRKKVREQKKKQDHPDLFHMAEESRELCAEAENPDTVCRMLCRIGEEDADRYSVYTIPEVLHSDPESLNLQNIKEAELLRRGLERTLCFVADQVRAHLQEDNFTAMRNPETAAAAELCARALKVLSGQNPGNFPGSPEIAAYAGRMQKKYGPMLSAVHMFRRLSADASAGDENMIKDSVRTQMLYLRLKSNYRKDADAPAEKLVTKEDLQTAEDAAGAYAQTEGFQDLLHRITDGSQLQKDGAAALALKGELLRDLQLNYDDRTEKYTFRFRKPEAEDFERAAYLADLPEEHLVNGRTDHELDPVPEEPSINANARIAYRLNILQEFRNTMQNAESVHMSEEWKTLKQSLQRVCNTDLACENKAGSHDAETINQICSSLHVLQDSAHNYVLHKVAKGFRSAADRRRLEIVKLIECRATEELRAAETRTERTLLSSFNDRMNQPEGCRYCFEQMNKLEEQMAAASEKVIHHSNEYSEMMKDFHDLEMQFLNCSVLEKVPDQQRNSCYGTYGERGALGKALTSIRRYLEYKNEHPDRSDASLQRMQIAYRMKNFLSMASAKEAEERTKELRAERAAVSVKEGRLPQAA